MPIENNSTLKYNHGEKSLKAPFTIYADLECLLVKQQSSQINPNDPYTEKKAMHGPCGYSLDLVSSYDSKQNKQWFYRGRDCIEKFCKDLKEVAAKTINYEEKEMIPNVYTAKVFCNASSVWGSLVKSYSLVVLINQSFITLY